MVKPFCHARPMVFTPTCDLGSGYLPGRVWYCTLVAGCIIPPHYAKKLLWRLDAIPPLPSNLPYRGPRGHDERVAVDAHDEHACELRELGARLEVAAESVVCHVTLQVQGLLVHRVHRLGRRSVCGRNAGYRKDRWRAGTCEAAEPYPPSPPALATRQARPRLSHFSLGTLPYPVLRGKNLIGSPFDKNSYFS